MKLAAVICRVLLGLAFIVFGANILFPFLPQPPPVEGSLKAMYMAVMVPSHWMQLVGLFQLIGGVLVLLGRTTPLGLCVLGPILINILSFHILLDNGNDLIPGLVFTVLELFLVYAYRANFRGIFTTRATPT